MGPLLLIWRLTARDLRRRLTQSALLLLVIAAGTSTLALAFALNGTSNDPWSATHAATAGPDIMAQTYPAKHPPLDELTALTHTEGVVGTSGPYPMASPARRRADRRPDLRRRPGRDDACHRPPLLDRRHMGPSRRVVIERGFAEQLKVRVGSRVTLDDRPFQVVGIAVDTDRGANWRPQLVWVTRPTRNDSPRQATSLPTW